MLYVMQPIKNIFILLSLVSFVACSQEQPIQIPEDKSEFFGVWVYKNNEYGNDVRIDNMLLVFHSNSTVSYKRCIKRMNGHKNTIVPEAKLIKLTDKEIVIRANIILMKIKLNFDIEKPPYHDNDNWHMKVDGALLRKLKPGESSNHESWDCGKKNKNEPTKEQEIKF